MIHQIDHAVAVGHLAVGCRHIRGEQVDCGNIGIHGVGDGRFGRGLDPAVAARGEVILVERHVLARPRRLPGKVDVVEARRVGDGKGIACSGEEPVCVEADAGDAARLLGHRVGEEVGVRLLHLARGGAVVHRVPTVRLVFADVPDVACAVLPVNVHVHAPTVPVVVALVTGARAGIERPSISVSVRTDERQTLFLACAFPGCAEHHRKLGVDNFLAPHGIHVLAVDEHGARGVGFFDLRSPHGRATDVDLEADRAVRKLVVERLDRAAYAR